ncbi:MAG: hypothetical protein IJI65_10625 [Lachnospiraceae bacterium]|nr:hypothetical protein [Lachnospiraceae bacterium]
MELEREEYLQKLIAKKDNGRVKIVTGIRRCGNHICCSNSSQNISMHKGVSIADPEKRKQEINSLTKIPDSFRKIVVVGDRINPWKDENGILYIGIERFLLDENAIDM